MWWQIRPLQDSSIMEFEKKFRFQIHKDLRGFLKEHNQGSPTDGEFPTTVRKRRMQCFLDFEDRESPNSAWQMNTRLRDMLGPKRIVIGKDINNNLICLERNHKEQFIVVWCHVTEQFERCLLDIPAFLRHIN